MTHEREPERTRRRFLAWIVSSGAVAAHLTLFAGGLKADIGAGGNPPGGVTGDPAADERCGQPDPAYNPFGQGYYNDEDCGTPQDPTDQSCGKPSNFSGMARGSHQDGDCGTYPQGPGPGLSATDQDCGKVAPLGQANTEDNNCGMINSSGTAFDQDQDCGLQAPQACGLFDFPTYEDNDVEP